MKRFYWALATYASAMFFGTLSTVLVKYVGLHKGISLIYILCLRALLSFLILFPSCFREVKKIRREHLKLVIIVGILSLLDTFCWHGSVALIPINNAIIISFCTPIFIALLAGLLLKEKLYWFHAVSFFVSIIGVALVYKISVTGFNYGYVLIGFSILSASFGFVFSKMLTYHYRPLLLVFIKVIATLALFLIGGIDCLLVFDLVSFTLVACAALAYVSERYCVTKAYQSCDIVPLQPARFTSIIFGSVLGYVLLGEKLHAMQILAFSFVCLANYINARSYTLKKKSEQNLLP